MSFSELALSTTITTLESVPSASFGLEDHQDIALALNSVKQIDSRLSGKSLMNPLRHALTGEKVGAGIAATIGTLGKSSAIARLQEALSMM